MGRPSRDEVRRELSGALAVVEVGAIDIPSGDSLTCQRHGCKRAVTLGRGSCSTPATTLAFREVSRHKCGLRATEEAMSEEVTSEGAEGVASVEGGSPPTDPPPDPVSSADDKPKKRKKIDLKSRLSSVRASGSMAAKPLPTDRRSDPLSFPPPPTGSVPAPRLGGMPSPLVSSPFAPPEPEKKPVAQQQTIKVEVGEEIVQERKRASKRVALVAFITALVVGALAFFVGKTAEKGTAGRAAVENAETLAGEVAAANEKVTAFSDALRAAQEKLSTDEFPKELAETLKATNIPFDAGNFQGRGVGGLPPQVLNQLIAYTSDVEKLNKQKDALQRLLGQVEKPVTEFIANKDKPKLKYSIVIGKRKDDYFADFALNKEPFEQKGDWPGEYTVLQKGEKGKAKEVEVKRWNGKDAVSGDPVALPLGEESLPEALSDKLSVLKLIQQIQETKTLIDGNESPIPQQQTDGLLKDGQELVEALKKVGAVGG